MKTPVCHVNARQRAVTTEEALHSHMDRRSWPVDVGEPFSLAIPVLVQQAHEQSNYGGRDGGCA